MNAPAARPDGPIRIAVVGGGYGAKVALPVYRSLDAFEPVAVWSRTGERARQIAAAHGLALGSDDLDEVLAVPGLEAVHVAVPVALHEDVAVRAADAGLHVLCEKPVALDLAGARRVAAAIDASGVVGMVNFSRRFEGARQRVLVLAGQCVGRLRLVAIELVHADHALPDSRPWSWVHDAAAGGGRLQGYGVHDLDLLLHLGADVEAVTAMTTIAVPERVDAATGRTGPAAPTEPDGTTALRPVTAEDGYAVVARLADGGLATLRLVSTARHGQGERIEVHGDAGTVRLDGDGAIRWGRAGEPLKEEPAPPIDPAEGFAAVAQRFAAAIRDGAPPEPPMGDGLRAQALLDAVRRSAAEHRWVTPDPA